jgi:mannose-1-phosphate guanylyltransferase/mannose-6-phosphate isomerase
VTFGIRPHYPETGYGYVEGGAEEQAGALAIRRFVEKPDRDTACGYLAAGNFFWNSGMFAFRASAMLEEFRAHQPQLLHALQAIFVPGRPIAREAYQQLTDISIDYAVMEKTQRGVVLPSDFGWSDIGSWKSLYDFLSKDPGGNVLEGDVLIQDTRNCLILAHDRLVAANRVSNLVVVETPDAIFVSDLDHSREVKSFVADLKQRGRSEYQQHRTVFFPWGTRTPLDPADGQGPSRLVVHPRACAAIEAPAGARVHFFILSGRANARAGRRRRRLESGGAVTLPGGSPVRIENLNDEPLTLIQVVQDGGPSPLRRTER